MADRYAKAMSKIVPTPGHSTSRFNEQFLDEVCPFRVFEIGSRGHACESGLANFSGTEFTDGG